MRVKTTEPLRPYYNYALVDLAEGEEVSGGLALYLLQTGSPVEPLDDAARDVLAAAEEPGAPAPDDLDITASVPEILAWVGDDRARAEQALAAEKASRDRPRTTLTQRLDEILAEQETDPQE
ncbi:hypothetical protein [Embleya sp. NPDC020630]|uniref:hypothetical protein n=1 Tax=Embleya sp. NPDC020630 TaxID=3363979 RepID=UPI00378761C0